jgi:uncharacterized membrane protein
MSIILSGFLFDPAFAEKIQSNGLALGAVVMIGLLAALIFTGWVLVRAFQNKPILLAPAWFDQAIPFLALAGLGVALYLTVIEATAKPALCGPIGDCNAVQQSPYALLFGILPVGVLGAFGFLAIFVVWLWHKVRKDKLAGLAPLALFGMAGFGTLFSVYLTYLELFVIHAVCIWCLSSAVLITLLMLFSLPAASRWLAASEED